VQNENELFSVYWWDAEDNQNLELRDVPAKDAAMRAVALSDPQRPINLLGGINRIIITDSCDLCVFEWKKGEGVVWPPKEEIDKA